MGQPQPVVQPVPFDFEAAYIPPYFKTGMYLVEVEKVKLNINSEPVLTFKVLDSHNNSMVNARKTINFFVSSDSNAAKNLWIEKLTEVLQALELKSITDLSVLVGQHLVMSMSHAGRETLPSFRKSTDFDKTWQPLSVRIAREKLQTASF